MRVMNRRYRNRRRNHRKEEGEEREKRYQNDNEFFKYQIILN